jgi:hypothetical protein
MPSLIIAAPPATNPLIVRCRYENFSSKSLDARGHVVSDLSRSTGGPAPDHKKERPMKIALLMLLLVATASPVLARPTRANRAEPSTITCETVRAYVSQVGLATATAMARANGMTAVQERKARQCLARRD